MQYARTARDEAQKKDGFLAILAHELRNPLAGISAALGLLDTTSHDSAKAEKLREVCCRQLGNLTRLVDDLLDVSRVSRGTVTCARSRWICVMSSTMLYMQCEDSWMSVDCQSVNGWFRHRGADQEVPNAGQGADQSEQMPTCIDCVSALAPQYISLE